MRFDVQCSQLRLRLKSLLEEVSALYSYSRGAQRELAESDLEEMTANVKLAYRHLEDAIMRLGKAIQACDGGKSVYNDKDRGRVE